MLSVRFSRTTARIGLLTIAVAFVLPACSSITPVAPWQKGTLARPEMTFEWDRLDTEYIDHTYSSKESASGGAGVGGGGCGCN